MAWMKGSACWRRKAFIRRGLDDAGRSHAAVGEIQRSGNGIIAQRCPALPILLLFAPDNSHATDTHHPSCATRSCGCYYPAVARIGILTGGHTMLRHQLRISVLLIAAFGAPVAMADLADSTTYKINFTGSGTLPTSGSFTYDPDTFTFSSFLVTWSDVTFDLTAGANAPMLETTGTGQLPPCLLGIRSSNNPPFLGGGSSFALLSGSCNPPSPGFITEWEANSFLGPTQPVFLFDTDDINAVPNSFSAFFFGAATTVAPRDMTDFGMGAWTITPVPEPCTVIPTLLFCTFVMRRRIAQGIRRATRINR
jgi:hypothetical protein